ncbi:5-methylcytosine-specific restriction enzyme B [Tsukamurella pulmonis]|uniref:5-methylcytosine-specific restriction enzyme B n=1 Tax=Tsukamurella pulmonis TaxID=47312 RepID=A0A1H1DPW6_9ACTN|nr:hypothetical protein [Tsukamurella pulmonis]SDQ78534.1 5-methylcytosine-specific restriction enzyme B [Tsukamurella pulmonis]SUP21820.1 Uncharacterised protein [Tsukamurella pulmonis]
MAQVRSISAGTQSVRRHPTEVDCFYTVVADSEGKVLHLSTFGSDQRASPGKSSQSIQFNEAIASELLEVILQTFPSLSRYR